MINGGSPCPVQWLSHHRTGGSIKTKYPVIKKGDTFDLGQAIEGVSAFIEMITDYDENQHGFINSIENGTPSFDLLFQDEEMKDLAENHPLTQWKKIKKVTS
jgi:hypothetical protein